jgi:hypothetical protein
MLQTMENERFELKNAANTVEMAASSSKMLQLARQTCRKNGCKKKPKRKKKTPKTIPDPFVVGCKHG